MMIIVGPVVLLSSLAFLFRPRSMDFAALHLPVALRLTGSLFGLMGLCLFAWMFRHLGLNVTSTSMPRDNAKLVTTGPYRWIRHPMYSAALILVVATTLLTANAVVLIGGILMFVLLAARSQIEERRLVERFGDAYRTYQRNTGRFVPRFRRGVM